MKVMVIWVTIYKVIVVAGNPMEYKLYSTHWGTDIQQIFAKKHWMKRKKCQI